MKELLLLVFLLLGSIPLVANMAQPVDPGSVAASPFTSRYVDVLHEDIQISIDAAFQRADYTVTYLIGSDTVGRQIPLLFYAAELMGPMTITLDGNLVPIGKIPNDFSSYDRTGDGTFRSYFEPGFGLELTALPESPTEHYHSEPEYYRYFTVDLTTGEHEIVVTYSAIPWTDRWKPVKEYSFRYALTPAKYWRSFGTLDVTVEREDPTQVLTSNLDSLETLHRDAVVAWSFQSLPTDIMEIRWRPELGWFKLALLDYGPLALTLFVLFLLLLVQVRVVRSENVLANGFYNFFAGLLVLLFWIGSFGIVDFMVGPHASATHGYLFMVVFIFPLVWLVYWVLSLIFRLWWQKESI